MYFHLFFKSKNSLGKDSDDELQVNFLTIEPCIHTESKYGKKLLVMLLSM